MATVLVTGTSSGFGLLIAIELARRGDRVFASMRNPDRSGALRDAAQAAGVADKVEVVALDVCDTASVRAAVADVIGAAGSLDAVVNNAGVGYLGPLEEMQADHVAEMFDTNVGGMLRVAQAVLPHMRAAGRGHVVNVTSIAAFISLPFGGVYSATKHAVDALGEALASEVAPWGIHVTNVAPGPYNTSMVAGVADAIAAADQSAYGDRLRQLVERHADAMRAADTPEDVAVAVADAIHAEPPPARIVVPASSIGVVQAIAPVAPEQVRELVRATYGI